MKTILLLLALTVAAQAQSPGWFKVANEGDTVSMTAQVRYGAAQGATAIAGVPCAIVGGCWVQLAVAGTFTVNNTFFKKDPILGTVKELDVQETASVQTVTVNGKPVTVPALPSTYTVTCTANIPSPPDPTVSYPATCQAVKQ